MKKHINGWVLIKKVRRKHKAYCVENEILLLIDISPIPGIPLVVRSNLSEIERKISTWTDFGWSVKEL